ncbi:MULTISPECIES: hypothetical protein [Paenibacillus]|uniref:Sporulation protein Cse60 n=1 Tax=Paenibacillus albilobatus TaxID=2716884 RepID=A0A920CEB6_9BACL|nr:MULTISPECIES: hypothetical protein [Paenibacillus]MDR9856659.1 hypothetical protein [Paenibacillus sp. VCA1]GIO33759.1 hypothetical protein J2TS6_49000 [Paenibacillus albilobatus]
MNRVKILESDTSLGLEREINEFLSDPSVENPAIHYTVGSKPDKVNRNIQVPLYTVMIYYSQA